MKIELNLRTLGYLIIFIAFVMFLLELSLTTTLMNINDTACTSSCGNSFDFCPYVHEVPLESIFISLASLVLVGVGVYMIVYHDFLQLKKDNVSGNVPNNNKDIIKHLTKNLSEEEKKVFDIIFESNGIYQSNLIEKSGFSRVKITRILDKLESRELIERKRRGMTNFVVIKNRN